MVRTCGAGLSNQRCPQEGTRPPPPPHPPRHHQASLLLGPRASALGGFSLPGCLPKAVLFLAYSVELTGETSVPAASGELTQPGCGSGLRRPAQCCTAQCTGHQAAGPKDGRSRGLSHSPCRILASLTSIPHPCLPHTCFLPSTVLGKQMI